MKKCLGCAALFVSTSWVCPSCGRQPITTAGIPVFAPELAGGDGTDATYAFDAFVRVEASHFWFRSRAALINRMMRAHFPAARSILEVGCGAGGVLVAIQQENPRAKLTGSELLVQGLQRAKRRLPDVDFVQMDARRIPFDREFDVIGAFDVIEHIDDDRFVLDQLRTALVPGGGVIVTVPQHPWLWSRYDEVSHHRRRYTRAELVTKLESAGLRPLRLTSFMSFAVPLVIATRVSRQTVDLEREVAVPPRAVNSSLLRLADLERALISAGVSLPFGSSLLAVATC
jgi:SAM-dependent methyltransferase